MKRLRWAFTGWFGWLITYPAIAFAAGLALGAIV